MLLALFFTLVGCDVQKCTYRFRMILLELLIMSTYPKNHNSRGVRASRPRKRKFNGNQFVCNKYEELFASASAKKLSNSSFEDVHYNPLHCYKFIEFFTVFTALADLVLCRFCNNPIKFEECSPRGLGFKLVLICQCGRRHISSGPTGYNTYEINGRIVFVMRLLGVGREGINLFCNMMDICEGLSQSAYELIIKRLHAITNNVFDICCKKAVKEEQEENKKHDRPDNNLKVSGDGSWRKRGFKSLYGVTSLIAYYSGKVIDLVVKSSFCSQCNYWKSKKSETEFIEWYQEHLPECSQNHRGSAGGMEVDSIKEMFLRSEEKFDLKYGNYIGDGDSKTFKGILDIKPYGDNFCVVKSECIGHVQKRMGSRLRKAKKDFKLGGRGKLTDALINKLTIYYGLAIRRNISSVNDMKSGIMATYHHMCSTDEKPNHEYYPLGTESWCKWQKAKACGEDPKLIEHPPPLHPDVRKYLLPIYQELSRDELLQRCLGGHTQNANESFNGHIWRLAPKNYHSGIKIVEIAAFLAAGIFNEGYSSILQIMNSASIIIGPKCKAYAKKIDKERVTRKNRRSLLATKEGRQARAQKRQEQNAFYEHAEGQLYGRGIND